MNKIIALILTCFIAGCNSDNSSNQQVDSAIDVESLNLTGTWERRIETRKVRIDNGAEISTSYGRNTYIFEDTLYGVEYNYCSEYGNFNKATAVKIEHLFYMSTNDGDEVGFAALNENQLQRVFSYEDEWSPGFTFYETETLTRISEEYEVDNGSFLLNGPVTVAEYDHICLWESYKLLGNTYTVNLSMPFDDDTLSISLRFIGDIELGSYTYTDYWDSEAVGIDIHSNANTFWNVVGSNTLGATNVTINITEVTSSKVIADFTLTGQDDGQYSGELEIDLYSDTTLNYQIIDNLN